MTLNTYKAWAKPRVKHWDVIQEEATEEQSKSGNPMFGNTFPKQ
jgi:predicted SnoaL-like aldol condensation-catalyzing enzyme